MRTRSKEDDKLAIPMSPFNKGHHQFITCRSLTQIANPRPTKCQHPDPGTSYHNSVPLLGDKFDTVHSCEGRLKRVGRGIRTAALPWDPHHGSSWNSIYSWDPPNDLEFTLDANRDLYDNLVEGDIMEEHPAPDNPSKKKQSKVLVSFVHFLFNKLNGLMDFLMLYRSSPMLSGWNSIDKPTLMKWFVGRVRQMLGIPTSVLTASPVQPPL